MRRPLKYQIMVPMSCVMLVTLVVVSLVDAWVVERRTRGQIERQLRDIGITLTYSSFPLTDVVLGQMRGLSGAEFVVGHPDGTMIASSGTLDVTKELLADAEVTPSAPIALDRRVVLNGNSYFHVPIDLKRRTVAGMPAVLHCFYPESSYRQAWREAVFPTVAVGAGVLLLVIIISSVIASRVTRPIDRLSDHVDRIAHGDFVPLAVPNRDDELRDLSIAVNHMAETLADYESQIRINERLKTLDQLGGGIAHQMRNSVTGCRMAIDLHQLRCPMPDDQSIPVAVAQLKMMEEYLRRFLSLGKQPEQPFKPVDLSQVVQDVLPLVRPRSEHLGVRFEWHPSNESLLVNGDSDALSQVVVNLILNAMDAATQRQPRHGDFATASRIRIETERIDGQRVCMNVLDSGEGPDERIGEKVFEPLVTGKRDGVGLGLAIVREIVQRHGGSVAWQRRDQMTCFSVELPLISQEISNADVTCCG